METKIKSGIDEIVFANRNKQYGAYYLRKVYSKFVTRALIVSSITILLVFLIPFIIFKQAKSVNVQKNVGAEFAKLDVPKEEDAPPPPPPPPPEALEQKVKFTAPIVTTDTVEDSGMLIQDDLNQQSTNTAPILEDDLDIVVDEQPKVIEQAAPILLIVEVMPSYNGGEEALYKYLADNIKYPQVARETGISGTVVVQFVVETDGSITQVVLLKDIGGNCGNEALRVVKAMPKWSPGKQNGIPARVQYQLPVKFSLD